MDISNSEIQTFLRCRRKWYYESSNLLSLHPAGFPETRLHVGTLVHKALDAIKEGIPYQEHVNTWAAKKKLQWANEYEQTYGQVLPESEYARQSENLVDAMMHVDRYIAHYGAKPFGDARIGASEITFKVPIPGTDGVYIGTIDLIAVDDKDRIWIVDHKTFKQKRKKEDLQIDLQLMGYTWAAHKIFTEQVGGAVYDGISKLPPSEPVLTKTGKVARVNQIRTTYKKLHDFIVANELDLEEYKEPLERLAQEEASDNPFFDRIFIKFPSVALLHFEDNLRKIYADMVRAKEQEHYYPTPSWMGCWDCSKQDLCKAQSLGEDWEWLRDTRYVKRSYDTIENAAKEPTKIMSIKELMEV